MRHSQDLSEAFGPPRVRKKKAVVYGYEVRAALEVQWRVFDFPCGQRLAPVVRAELDRLRPMKELDVPERTAEKPLQISPRIIGQAKFTLCRQRKITLPAMDFPRFQVFG